MNIIDIIAQFGIIVFGVFAIVCVSIKKPELGCIFGLISQPFWFYSLIDWSYAGNIWQKCVNRGQLGIILLAIVYTGSWILGIYNYWFKKC